MKRRHLLFAASGALVMLATGLSPGASAEVAKASGSVIPIGVVGSYSGVQAAANSPAQGAIKAWADALNAAGGIDGHRVKLYIEDDQDNAATSLTEVQSLVEQDHV